MLDRIHRLLVKNAIALGDDEVRLEVVTLPGGRVRIGYRSDIERRVGEVSRPITYPSLDAAYRASLNAHIRAHRCRDAGGIVRMSPETRATCRSALYRRMGDLLGDLSTNADFYSPDTWRGQMHRLSAARELRAIRRALRELRAPLAVAA